MNRHCSGSGSLRVLDILLKLQPGSRERTGLERWLAGLELQFAGNVLVVDLETSHIWGEIAARAQRIGETLSAGDGLISAAAIRHGLHVMTRNVRHFEPTGVLVVNPWTDTTD